jgi:hypothetical protein
MYHCLQAFHSPEPRHSEQQQQGILFCDDLKNYFSHTIVIITTDSIVELDPAIIYECDAGMKIADF